MLISVLPLSKRYFTFHVVTKNWEDDWSKLNFPIIKLTEFEYVEHKSFDSDTLDQKNTYWQALNPVHGRHEKIIQDISWLDKTGEKHKSQLLWDYYKLPPWEDPIDKAMRIFIEGAGYFDINQRSLDGLFYRPAEYFDFMILA
ncbi:MAG: hypothetical protein LBJ12_00075 [Oscillospiraceae bacterium]|nr:hypothetical protein [Oscillospiraceae bacterium]